MTILQVSTKNVHTGKIFESIASVEFVYVVEMCPPCIPIKVSSAEESCAAITADIESGYELRLRRIVTRN